MTTNPERGTKKTRVGTVVSDTMQKTVIVEVGRVYRHPFYDKVVRAHSRLYVHDERGEAEAGDTVRVEECRPMSRLKRWRIVEVVKKGKGASATAGAEQEVRELEESIRGAKDQSAGKPSASGGEGQPDSAGDVGGAGEAVR